MENEKIAIIGNHNEEEWGGWKIVSDMLDNPNENGIYPTSKCYEELYNFVVNQRGVERDKQTIEIEKIKKIQIESYKYDKDEYSRGLANGLILAISIINGEEPEYIKRVKKEKEQKNKWVAVFLAFLLGGLGIHKFYLGQHIKGLLYLCLCWTYIPVVISFFEIILLAILSQEEFDRRYN